MRCAYGDNLEPWLPVFCRDERYIGYYSDLQGDPHGLPDDLCRFLGVTPFAPGNGVRERVNLRQGVGIEIPAAVRGHLASSPSHQLDKRHELLGPGFFELGALLAGVRSPPNCPGARRPPITAAVPRKVAHGNL